MKIDQVSEFIEQQQKLNKSQDEIRDALVRAGWSEQDINDSFSAVNQEGNSVSGGDLPSFSELLRESWMIFKIIKYKLLFTTFSPFLGLILLLILSIIFVIVFSFMRVVWAPLDPWIDSVLLVYFILFIGFIFILSIWSSAASAFLIANNQEKLPLKKILSLSIKFVIPFIVSGVIVSLLNFAGIMFFIIPGIILAVWFSLVKFVIVDENRRGLDALIVSRNYIKGFFWDVLWRFIAIGLGFIVLLMVISLFSENFMRMGTNVSRFVVELVNLLLVIFFFIFSLLIDIYVYLVYKNLKKIKGKLGNVTNLSRWKYTGATILPILIFIFMLSGMLYLFFTNKNFANYTSEAFIISIQKSKLEIVHLELRDYKNKYGIFPESLEEVFQLSKESNSKVYYEDVEYYALNNFTEYNLCVNYSSTRYCFDQNRMLVSKEKSEEQIDQNEDFQDQGQQNEPGVNELPEPELNQI